MIAAVPERASALDVLVTRDGDLRPGARRDVEHPPPGAGVPVATGRAHPGPARQRRHAAPQARGRRGRRADPRGGGAVAARRRAGARGADVALGDGARAGSGCLAVQARASDGETIEVLSALDHAPSRMALETERGLMARLGGGCALPLGAFAEPDPRGVRLVAIALSPDGSRIARPRSTARRPRRWPRSPRSTCRPAAPTRSSGSSAREAARRPHRARDAAPSGGRRPRTTARAPGRHRDRGPGDRDRARPVGRADEGAGARRGRVLVGDAHQPEDGGRPGRASDAAASGQGRGWATGRPSGSERGAGATGSRPEGVHDLGTRPGVPPGHGRAHAARRRRPPRGSRRPRSQGVDPDARGRLPRGCPFAPGRGTDGAPLRSGRCRHVHERLDGPRVRPRARRREGQPEGRVHRAVTAREAREHGLPSTRSRTRTRSTAWSQPSSGHSPRGSIHPMTDSLGTGRAGCGERPRSER